MDELTLRRARAGDTEAFEQLMTPLEPRIWRICWHYLGEREAASDCAQEAMVRIWRGLGSYREDSSLESWAYRVAANVCLDELRRRKRHPSESLEPLREKGFDPEDRGPGVEAQVIAREQKERLRECIARLPEDQREALVLTQLENVPYEQAAATLGTTEGTIKSRVNRAKARLREWMSGETEKEPSSRRSVQQRERRGAK